MRLSACPNPVLICVLYFLKPNDFLLFEKRVVFIVVTNVVRRSEVNKPINTIVLYFDFK